MQIGQTVGADELCLFYIAATLSNVVSSFL